MNAYHVSPYYHYLCIYGTETDLYYLAPVLRRPLTPRNTGVVVGNEMPLARTCGSWHDTPQSSKHCLRLHNHDAVDV